LRKLSSPRGGYLPTPWELVNDTRLAELPPTETTAFALCPHKSVAVRGAPALIHRRRPRPFAARQREENPKGAAHPLTVCSIFSVPTGMTSTGMTSLFW
jgi:hypothetical protein